MTVQNPTVLVQRKMITMQTSISRINDTLRNKTNSQTSVTTTWSAKAHSC